MKGPSNVRVPEGGWNLGEVTYAVLTLAEPNRDLDAIVDLLIRAGFVSAAMVEASFAGWASKEPPRYTSDPRCVRAMARHYGFELASRDVSRGVEATASGGTVAETACAFNRATAELAAFLLAVRAGGVGAARKAIGKAG